MRCGHRGLTAQKADQAKVFIRKIQTMILTGFGRCAMGQSPLFAGSKPNRPDTKAFIEPIATDERNQQPIDPKPEALAENVPRLTREPKHLTASTQHVSNPQLCRPATDGELQQQC
jgi:hypothetical protein